MSYVSDKDFLPQIPDHSIQLRSILEQVTAPRVVRVPEIVRDAHNNRASEFYKRLVAWINKFEASLDEQHEVGVKLVSFGQAMVFHLAGLGYWDPSLIKFYGETDAGEPVELIQHVTQISILLTKVPRAPGRPKQSIGFRGNE